METQQTINQVSPELVAQQKAYKESKEAFKSRIKELSTEQTALKNQRKTVNLKGERDMSPGIAQATHALNRYELHHLFLAYGMFRERHGGYTKFHEVPVTKDSGKFIAKLIEKYGSKTVHFNS